jgi:hypothetical protein
MWAETPAVAERKKQPHTDSTAESTTHEDEQPMSPCTLDQPAYRRKVQQTACWSAATVACLACGASYPEPRAQLMATESALAAAEGGGAQGGSQSGLYLKWARDQLAAARQLISDGENERAEWVLKRAEADAQLALALANEATQRQRAIETKEELDQLSSTLQRGRRP